MQEHRDQTWLEREGDKLLSAIALHLLISGLASNRVITNDEHSTLESARIWLSQVTVAGAPNLTHRGFNRGVPP